MSSSTWNQVQVCLGFSIAPSWKIMWRQNSHRTICRPGEWHQPRFHSQSGGRNTAQLLMWLPVLKWGTRKSHIMMFPREKVAFLEVDPIFRHTNTGRSVTLDFIQVAYKYWSAYFSTIYQAGFDCVILVQYHIEVSLPFCCLEWRVVWLVEISVCPKLGSTVYCRIILHVYPLLSLFQYSNRF